MQKPIDCSPDAQNRVLYQTLILVEHMTDQRQNSSWVADTSDEVRIEAHQAASDALYKHYFPRKNAWDRICLHGSTINWKMDCAHHDICPFCMHVGLEGGSGLVRSCANCKTHISKPGEQVWKHCVADPYEDLFIRHHGQVDRSRYSCDECKGWATLDNGSACPKCNPRGGE